MECCRQEFEGQLQVFSERSLKFTVNKLFDHDFTAPVSPKPLDSGMSLSFPLETTGNYVSELPSGLIWKDTRMACTDCLALPSLGLWVSRCKPVSFLISLEPQISPAHSQHNPVCPTVAILCCRPGNPDSQRQSYGHMFCPTCPCHPPSSPACLITVYIYIIAVSYSNALCTAAGLGVFRGRKMFCVKAVQESQHSRGNRRPWS